MFINLTFLHVTLLPISISLEGSDIIVIFILEKIEIEMAQTLLHLFVVA